MNQMASSVQNTDNDSSVDALFERARALIPMIRENAAEAERERRVPDSVIDAMSEAGLFRLAQPRRYGGLQAGVKNMLELSSIVAEGDGGTAWVVALVNGSAWLVGLFPERAQDDVFGQNPQARVTGVLAPSSTARRVDGGFVVSGKWYYNSGSWHADWAVLGIPIVNEAGETVDQGMALIPSTDLGFEDTWFVSGMRASGSNCAVAEEVFVPDHRIFSVPRALEGDYPTELKDTEIFYRSAFVPTLALVLIGAQLGLGRAALAFVMERAAKKPIPYTFMTSQAESVGFQLQLADAAQAIDTAHLHAYRAAADVDSAALAGTYPDPNTRARIRADVGLVAERISHAIDLLLSAHGAGSFAEASPLQRIWRDSAVAARHAVVSQQVANEIYGKALAGAKQQITPLI